MTTPTGCSLEAYASAKNLPASELEQWGLRTEGSLEQWGLRTEGSRVAIPYFGTDGRESGAVRYRHALEGKHRFSWRPGSTPTLYNLQFIAAARDTGTIVLVEGESDTMTCWHHKCHAVGLPGAATFKSEWLAHFDGFDAVFVVVEPDSGGKALLKSIAKQPSEFKDLVRLVTPTRFKDPAELHLDDPEHFKVRFDAALAGAEPWASYADRQAWVQELDREQGAPSKKRRLVLGDLSDVEPVEVSWLWPGRLARGKYTSSWGSPTSVRHRSHSIS